MKIKTANGSFWYAPLGLSAYFLNAVVAVMSYLQNAASPGTILFSIAALCALIHGFGTFQAIPAGRRFIKFKDNNDEATLNKSFDKFARWVVFRGIVGVPMFLAILWGLISVS